jgi:serine/threonine protein kinase
VLLGGVFMQRFEGIRPVVQRAAHTARVIAVSLGEGGAVPQSFRSALREWSHGHPLTATDVYIASGDAISLDFWSNSMGSTKATICIDGYSWYAVPAFPNGILVMSTKFSSVGDKRRIGFYVESNILNELLGTRVESKMDVVSNQMETFDYVGGSAEHLSLNISTSTDAFSEGIDALDISMNSEEHNRSDQNINLEDSGASDKFTMHKSHHHLKSLVSRHFGDSPSMSPLVNNDQSIISADDSKLFQSSPIERGRMGVSTLDLTASGSEYFRIALRDPQLAMCNKAEPAVVLGSVLGLVMQFLGEESAKPKTIRRSRSLKAEANAAFTVGGDSTSADLRGFHAIRSVCKHWGVQAANYLVAKRVPKSGKAFRALVAGANLSNYYTTWSEFLKGITSCEHIGTGGAKCVYSVARKNSQNISGIEALATIDVDVVVDHAVKQELSVSTLASTLVQMRICPNILETYSTFESPYCIPKNFSGSSARSVIAKPKSSEVGHYQYILMELCRGGDIESSIRRQTKKVLPLDNVRSFLFQMIFSLYSSREQLNLRHNDVKLLNFLLSDASSLLPPKPSPSMSGERRDSPRCNKISMKLWFGEHVFKLSLPMTPTCPSLVKLADFGTSQVGSTGAETSITPEHFTTLENTPPEFLLLGSKASSSSFACDTFGLGLCYLHLLTGVAPYEELLNEVSCPPDLRSLLKELWTTNDRSSQYYVIHEVLDSLVEGDADTDDEEPALGQRESAVDDDSVMNVLYDTLYRFVVLVGLPPIDLFAGIDASTGSMARNPVVLALHAALAGRQQTFGVDAVRNSMHIYNQDAAKWSISVGSSEHMNRARDRLRDLSPSAGALLQSMLSLDPTKRCTMHEALLSDVFSVYREGGLFATQDGIEVVYDYYAKPKSCGGCFCLPNV